MRGAIATVLAVALVSAAACGGTVVFDERGSSSEGGGSATGHVSSAIGGPGATSGDGTGGTGGGVVGAAEATTQVAASSSSSGGRDGACIAPDYCSCVEYGPTCRVVAEDCFCACDEACEEPCDCDCAGGAFLGCAPGSIQDPHALDAGVWLVGWSGDVNHYSWLRFGPDGRLDVLDGRDIQFDDPYFPCSGAGAWSFGEPFESVVLALPPPCDPTTLEFGDWFWGVSPTPGSQQTAFLFDETRGVTLGAWRYPDDQCRDDFTQCKDPFAP